MITSPTLLLDKKKVIHNIERMYTKAKSSHVDFRPHFKTHQSAVIGEWIRAFGVEKITVSSVEMAAYFAANNWHDITIAFPLNPLEFDAVNRLADRISLNITISTIDAAQMLASSGIHPVGYFIEIDTGYARTGIAAVQYDGIQQIIDALESSPHQFRGFLVHAGNTYQARGRDDILAIYQENIEQFQQLYDRFFHASDMLILSYGDTPSCSVVERFEVVNEIRPGNFVFYDVSQKEIGSCEADDIAVALVCPVVAIHRDRKEVMVHAGAVHLSRDFILKEDRQMNFGEVVGFDAEGWHVDRPFGHVNKLSQEHGTIHATDEFLKSVKVGDVVAILPIHSCLTADSMNRYVDLEGNVILQRPKNLFSGSGATEYGNDHIQLDELMHENS